MITVCLLIQIVLLPFQAVYKGEQRIRSKMRQIILADTQHKNRFVLGDIQHCNNVTLRLSLSAMLQHL